MSNKICSVVQGILESGEGTTIDLKSPQWFEWLETHKSFRYSPVGNDSPFTARREGEYWYGYRKQQGKLHKRYIGKAGELTTAKLEEIAGLLNVPTESRPKSVTVTNPVTDKSSVTISDVDQLWQALSELRQEVASLGKIESSVTTPKEVTRQQSNDQSILEELQAQLQKNQSQIKELSSEIKTLRHENQELHEQLQKAREELHNQVTNSSSQAQEHEKSELQNTIGNYVQPDYTPTRDRVLAKLKIGRQSAGGKAIEAFIRELNKLSTNER
ncbi:hypothetical protein FACHB389_18975 [Nostoc calcicola FACHB-389]|nr:hypothetical protein [Nostoc calcicola FACHB-3891]OKH32881.1 hypothetical protein FACHB389_18975 [Nostoc calcicola FACHB-389]